MEEDVIIPVVFFLTVLTVTVVWFYLKHRNRVEMQHTFRLALEKGSELTPELIRTLGDPEPSRTRDLRRALVSFALALGLVLCGIALGDADAFRGILAGAAFPFAIGCAYLVMYVYGTKDES